MLPDTILQSDLLDILFENRNKAYGAYALRKSYNKTIITATSITLIIATVFSLIQYMHYNKHHELVRTYIIPPDAEFTRFKDPEPMKPITPKPQRTHVPANEVIYSAPVISNNNDETKIPAINDLANNIIGDQNIKGTGEVDIVQPPAETREVDDNSEKIIEVKPDDSPLAFAQIMPEYPGGIEALKKFMLKNLIQPDDLNAGEKIVVLASFIMGKNGHLEQVKIIKSGRTDLDQEVQRVINKMPVWKPGLQNGNAVAVYLNLPVTFMNLAEE